MKGEVIMKISLFCSGGFSTSLLAKKMQKAYEEKGITDNVIEAFDFAMIDEVEEDVDIIMIGPQISWAYDQVKEKYPDKKVILLTMAEFGSMNGNKIIEKLENEL